MHNNSALRSIMVKFEYFGDKKWIFFKTYNRLFVFFTYFSFSKTYLYIPFNLSIFSKQILSLRGYLNFLIALKSTKKNLI